MGNQNTQAFKKATDRPITRVSRPFKAFIKNEAISGVLLITSVIVALILTNSTAHDQFEAIWAADFGIVFGSFSLIKSLHLWINDFLMALFFLLVGLEIKREILIGELSSMKRALLPAVAAVGGMVIPALVFVLFNPPGTEGAPGWAIPMATDIAFALGILFLLGKRVPTSIRVFLTSLAIVDDIGAVLVIAFFYTDKIIMTYLIYGAILVALLLIFNKLGVNSIFPYLIVGLLLWYFFLKSGVHATLAGIILAITIPATTKINYEDFREISTNLVNQMNSAVDTQELERRNLKIYLSTVQTLEKACEDVEAPLQKLEHQLVGLVSFLIMPIFAISNAGVLLDIPIFDILANRIVLGILFGLLVGKPIGIFGFTYIADHIGLVEKPVQLSWMQILGTSFLAGIGFTMSIFISVLAFPMNQFPAGILIGYSKIAILLSSTLAAVIGASILIYSSMVQK